jgi:hypothetical protein
MQDRDHFGCFQKICLQIEVVRRPTKILKQYQINISTESLFLLQADNNTGTTKKNDMISGTCSLRNRTDMGCCL